MVFMHGIGHNSKLELLWLQEDLPGIRGAKRGLNALDELERVALTQYCFHLCVLIGIDENRG